MDRPRASVVVLGFNGRAYLRDCLTSVLDQEMDCAEYEVVYVDNGSKDGSLDLVTSEFTRVRTVGLPENLGFAEGNNVGYRESDGAYVVFLNQDTIVHKRWLPELVAAADSSPEIGACHSNMIMPWHPEFEAQERAGHIEALYVPDLSRFGFVSYRRRLFSKAPVDTIFLAGAAVLVKRQVLDGWGYAFASRFFAYCEDTDLALRLWGSGYRNVVVPTSVLYHHHTLTTELSRQTLRKTLSILRNRWLAFYRNMKLPEFLAFSPMLLIGSCLKPGEFGLSRRERVTFGVAMLPLMAVALVQALFQMPAHHRERREILSRRVIGRFSLLRELMRR